jgi:hypothetical protein
LSRIRWLFVIAQNSSFTYKGRAVAVKQVGRELGVLHVLEGSVRKAGNRIRITAQLLDATTGDHLWTAEQRRSTQRPTDDLTAYALYLRANAHVQSWEREGTMRALNLLGQALERDPRYGLALAPAAQCHLI